MNERKARTQRATEGAQGSTEEADTHLVVLGASEHNLQRLNCHIPRGALAVVCGPSGSGKTTLVFDVIGREAERIVYGPLSALSGARLGRYGPLVEAVLGVAPPVFLSRPERVGRLFDTVATVSGVEEPLRELWRLRGEQRCDRCGGPLVGMHPDASDEKLRSTPGQMVWIVAPIEAPFDASKGERLIQDGVTRIVWNEERHSIESILPLLGVGGEAFVGAMALIDAVNLGSAAGGSAGAISRISKSTRFGCEIGHGRCLIQIRDGADRTVHEWWCATVPWCATCRENVPPLRIEEFQLKRGEGACSSCKGLAHVYAFLPPTGSEEAVLTIGEIPALLWGRRKKRGLESAWKSFLRSIRVREEQRVQDLTPRASVQLWYGKLGERLFLSPRVPQEREERSMREHGVIGYTLLLHRTHGRSQSRTSSSPWLGLHLTEVVCPICRGARYGPRLATLSYQGHPVSKWMLTAVEDLLRTVVALPRDESDVINRLSMLLRERLQSLVALGLGYLPLSRSATSLSEGEWRRASLVSQLGSTLERLLYLVDEPTIGLDAQSVHHVYDLLRALTQRGQTVIVVEHDEWLIQHADYLVELGPGGGAAGGKVVFSGRPLQRSGEDVRSLSQQFVPKDSDRGTRTSEPPPAVETPVLRISGIHHRNLRELSLEIPLGKLVVVTGPSGVGKTTALVDSLVPALQRLSLRGRDHRELTLLESRAFGIARIEGAEHLERVAAVGHASSTRGGRATVAALLGVLPQMREFFAALPEARLRGWGPEIFSPTDPRGTCPRCLGRGYLAASGREETESESGSCPSCSGTGLAAKLGEVRYRGHSMLDLFQITLQEASLLLGALPQVRRQLETAVELGIGYLRWGQRGRDLSHGERQRVRLIPMFSTGHLERVFMVVDEPTSGLGLNEVRSLINLFRRAISRGASLVVIEHHPLVLDAADLVIRMEGPGV